jgi:hypothetical protein
MDRFLSLLPWWRLNDYHFIHPCSSAFLFHLQPQLWRLNSRFVCCKGVATPRFCREEKKLEKLMNIGLFCVFDIFSLFLSYNESLQ